MNGSNFNNAANISQFNHLEEGEIANQQLCAIS
jgi:hypothetical protein